MFAGGHDLALDLVTGDDLVLLRQELHRKVHAVEFAPRHRQVTALFGTTGQQHGVEFGVQLLGRQRGPGVVGDPGVGRHRPDQHAAAEDHALGLHLRDAAVDVRSSPS